MKKIVILITIGLVLTFKLEAKKIEGKIFFADDTIDVTFNIPINFFTQEPNYEKLQYKVKYFDSAGRKIVLKLDNAKEIQFKYEYENVRMLSRFNSIGLGNIFSMSTNIFLKLEMDGKLKLFSYYYTQHSGGTYNSFTGMSTGGYSYSVEKYILQKENGELMRPVGLSFKKDMIDYFSDCPSLVEKIESKEFRKNDLESMVRYYNLNCR
ncbi:MAG: hypothetical protein ACOYXB_06495 [Bacteroidota bacterium]